MHRLLLIVAVVAMAASGVIACRQDEPAGDPKTPANSPLPDIEKKDDPKPAPTPKLPLLGDAG